MTIVPLTTDAERDACARIMAGSDPWTTLGIGVERARAVFDPPDREYYVARDGDAVAGFVVISMQGVLRGYLQTIAVAADRRGTGLGARLLEFVERRVFRDSPNVFLFVSSFNAAARRFYEAHGYEAIGEVRDFLVAGHGEWLMRKTIGPIYPTSR